MPKHNAEQFNLLLGDHAGKPADNEAKWKKWQTRKLLDLYCFGEHPTKIAYIIKRTPESVRTRIKEFSRNLHGRAERYVPSPKRISRKGKRLTENEFLMIRSFRKRGLNVKWLANVLARDPSDFRGAGVTKSSDPIPDVRSFAPTLDIIWAFRYAYFVWGKDYPELKKLITDEQYDDLVKEEIEYGGGEAAFEHIKSSKIAPSYIRSLALYLAEKSKMTKLK